jgi:hypothetical protein
MTCGPGLPEREGELRGRWAAAGLAFPGRPSWAGFHFFLFCFFSIFYFPGLFFDLFETFLFSFGSTFIL